MHSTAVGKVLLAFEEPWIRESYLHQELQPVASRTVIQPHTLSQQLTKIHDDGYAITLEEQRVGACSIAVPVFHTGRIGAALGLVIASEKVDTLTKHLPALRGISQRIEKATAHIPLETLLESHRGPRRT